MKYRTIVCAAHARSCSDPRHMTPYVCVYRLWQCHSNTPPRILLPTNSVARVHKEDDMPGDGNSIDAEANPKSVQTDAPRVLVRLNQKMLTQTPAKIVSALEPTKVFGSSTPPATYLSPYARSLVVSFIDRSLKPALTVQGLITPDDCLA